MVVPNKQIFRECLIQKESDLYVVRMERSEKLGNGNTTKLVDRFCRNYFSKFTMVIAASLLSVAACRRRLSEVGRGLRYARHSIR